VNDTFVYDTVRHRWLHFSKPRRIVAAHAVADVLPALRSVENAVEGEGLHAAGFVAYDAAAAFDRALETRSDPSFPLLWFGLYDPPTVLEQLPSATEKISMPRSWRSSISDADYKKTVATIKRYIAEGDTYQVNFTYRLRARFNGSPWSLFTRLTQRGEGGCAAFVETDDWAVCSVSPELFFRRDGISLLSRPMKGTAPRGTTLADDERRAHDLHLSVKDRAENIMITDMVRSDMGRIARTGTVCTPDIFTVEKYPTVWQMTSSVEACTNAGVTELFRALFPPASITGAPKCRAMQIIKELECDPRRIYTGAIGFIAPGRQVQFNVAIRTALIDKRANQIEYGVGGGIVWDSTAVLELKETQIKALVLKQPPGDFSLLETILWRPQTGFHLLDRHLARLRDSASYFSFEINLKNIRRKLADLVKILPEKPHKIRLLLASGGWTTIQSRVLPDEPASRCPPSVCLAATPVNSSDPFLYHKTTRREPYERARTENPAFNDVILWNSKGEITESTIANIVIETDGQLITPPASCGLLAGVQRAEMLAKGILRERVITVPQLKNATRIYLINSVRGQYPVKLEQNGKSNSV